MKALLIVSVLLMASVGAAFAQEKEESSKWEFYGGFSTIRGEHKNPATGTNNDNSGFEVSATRSLNRYVGVKLDYSRNSRSERLLLPIFGGINLVNSYSSHFYTAGLQLKDNASKGKIKPFAHALFGGRSTGHSVRSTNCPPQVPTCDVNERSNSLALILGGGVDIKLNKRFSLRPLQVDYVMSAKAMTPGIERNNVRIGAGVVVHADRTEIDTTSKPTNFPRYEIHGGFVYGRSRDLKSTQPSSTVNFNIENLNGYNASIKWNFHRYLGAEFEQSTSWSGTKTFDLIATSLTAKRTLFTYAGGIQVKDNKSRSRFKPFGHALFGAASSVSKIKVSSGLPLSDILSNESNLLLMLGGGLEIKVNEHYSVRALQVDYLRPRGIQQSSGNLNSMFRFGVGVVFH